VWLHVEVVFTDVSEERIASIFRVEGKIRKSARKASVRDVKSRLLHGATSQKTAFFIVTAVKTSNLTQRIIVTPCKFYCEVTYESSDGK
jgi:hypothetical protein